MIAKTYRICANCKWWARSKGIYHHCTMPVPTSGSPCIGRYSFKLSRMQFDGIYTHPNFGCLYWEEGDKNAIYT